MYELLNLPRGHGLEWWKRTSQRHTLTTLGHCQIRRDQMKIPVIDRGFTIYAERRKSRSTRVRPNSKSTKGKSKFLYDEAEISADAHDFASQRCPQVLKDEIESFVLTIESTKFDLNPFHSSPPYGLLNNVS